jgi:hypothetical protein
VRVADGLDAIIIPDLLGDPLHVPLLGDQLVVSLLVEGEVDLLARGHAGGTSEDGLNRDDVEKAAAVVPLELLFALQANVLPQVGIRLESFQILWSCILTTAFFAFHPLFIGDLEVLLADLGQLEWQLRLLLALFLHEILDVVAGGHCTMRIGLETVVILLIESLEVHLLAAELGTPVPLGLQKRGVLTFGCNHGSSKEKDN